MSQTPQQLAAKWIAPFMAAAKTVVPSYAPGGYGAVFEATPSTDGLYGVLSYDAFMQQLLNAKTVFPTNETLSANLQDFADFDSSQLAMYPGQPGSDATTDQNR